jgi:hypothetical protein
VQGNPQIYHRLQNHITQPSSLGQIQKASGEIWGKAANYGTIPCVKAYIGRLPDNAHGIEFTTPIPHDLRHSTPRVALNKEMKLSELAPKH